MQTDKKERVEDDCTDDNRWNYENRYRAGMATIHSLDSNLKIQHMRSDDMYASITYEVVDEHEKKIGKLDCQQLAFWVQYSGKVDLH